MTQLGKERKGSKSLRVLGGRIAHARTTNLNNTLEKIEKGRGYGRGAGFYKLASNKGGGKSNDSL